MLNKIRKHLDRGTIISTLENMGWAITVHDYTTDVIEATHSTLKAMIEFIPPGPNTYYGRINVANTNNFNKWGDSEDYSCYRYPRTDRQLMNLLLNIEPILKRDALHPSNGSGIDITYLLRQR